MSIPLAGSTAKDDPKASASRFYLLSLKACTTTPCLLPLHHIHDKFWRTDDKVTFSMRCSANQKNHVLICCVTSLQDEQTLRRSPVELCVATIDGVDDDDEHKKRMTIDDAQEEESQCQRTIRKHDPRQPSEQEKEPSTK